MGGGGGEERCRVCMRPGEEEDHGWRAFGCGCAESGENTFEVVLKRRRGLVGNGGKKRWYTKIRAREVLSLQLKDSVHDPDFCSDGVSIPNQSIDNRWGPLRDIECDSCLLSWRTTLFVPA